MMAFLRTFLLLLLVGVSAFVTSGQTTTNRKPLQLVVTLESSSVCQGGSVAYLAKIINLGKEVLSVDANRIGSSVLIKRADRTAGRNQSDSSDYVVSFPIPSHYRPNFVILAPRESFPVGRAQTLDRNQALGPGRYNMKVFYEQSQDFEFLGTPVWKGIVESRNVSMFIKPCS